MSNRKNINVKVVSDRKNILGKLKFGKKIGVITKWVIGGCITVTTLSTSIYYFHKNSTSDTTSTSNNTIKVSVVKENKKTNSDNSSKSVELKTSTPPIFYNTIPTGRGVQLIKTIAKENADCTSPIVVRDSIVFSPNSPKGCGNIIEIKDNKPDDSLYFENEHNTLWYKFTTKNSGNLTFDIIPLSQNDDYDFILYRYMGKDFSSKVVNKQIKPLRTCISRNDKKLKSMTGLSLDESSKGHIHSGIGASYVKYVRVKKGDVFYLLIDNVYNSGSGHSIRFHYKTFAPGELYVGLTLPLGDIKFIDSDYAFKRGSEKGLDALYKFLVTNPRIKIQIDGHVNSARGNIVSNYTELELSQKRAEAIYDFLRKKKIDPKRLSTMGYGSRKMIFPNAQNSQEMKMNIRAEITIVSLD